ncbi:hypothetical protein ACQJBY_032534 [Aegilops geniculata]
MAAPSRTSWADVADAEPAPPAPVPAAAPVTSNGPARADRSSYVPPHLRNRSSSTAPPVSSAPPPRAAPGLLGRPTSGVGGRFGGGGAPPRRWDREPNPFGDEEEVPAEPVPFDEHQNTGINFEAYEDIPVETSGREVPPAVGTFAEIDLGAALNDNIRRCKYVRPTPVQRHAIPISLAGRDLMACAQTGSGKTAAFCFPIISGIMRGPPVQRSQRGGSRTACPLALILSPTRELSMQIHEEARKFSYQTGVRVVVAYGGAPITQQRMASDFLENYIFLAVGRVGSSTELIAQRVEFVQEADKRSHLMDLLHAQRDSSEQGKQALTLVFVETKRGADSLENWLCTNGFPATSIHGDRNQQEREYALRSFKSGQTPILVATDVAARGLDIPHVAHVVNFDLPNDIDDYVHRIGRTGRAGKSGIATAFFNDNNSSMAKSLADLMQESNQEVPAWLTRYAARPSYGGGGGRNRRGAVGGSRFGGRDFRRDSSSFCKGGGASDYAGGSSYGGGGYGGAGAPSAWD